MAQKVKIVLVGGMDYNVPDELKDNFEIVRHISQGERYNTLPQADFVFVITAWTNHNIVDQVKHDCKLPIVWLRPSWSQMKEELTKRSLLPPDGAPEAAVKPGAVVQQVAASTLGLSEAEIWKKFGEKMIEACRTLLKVGDKVSEKDLLDVLAMAGPPAEDCWLFLPKLQMLGVIAPSKNDLWRLASSDEEAYEVEAEVEQTPPTRRKAKMQEMPGERTASEQRLRMIPGNPALVTRLIAGLPMGPYPTKASVYREMRKYKEFAGLTDNQVKLAFDRAVEQKIIDDTHASLFIDHKDDMMLTRLQTQETQEEPEIPKSIFQEYTANTPPPVVVPKGLSQADVEKKWCYVVEQVKNVRARLSEILVHCRIEWMDTNKVLVIFVPVALSNCMKFLESTENWGTVSRVVQERFSQDTVLRFLLDNGLRA